MSNKSFSDTEAELIAINNVWEEKITSPTATWASLFKFLEYDSHSILHLRKYFYEHIIHPNDKNYFFEHLNNFLKKKERFKYKVRLKDKYGEYKLYEAQGKLVLIDEKISSHDMVLRLKRTVQSKISSEDLLELDFFHRETASMTNTGGWYVDVASLAVFWDEQAKDIYGVPPDFNPKHEEVITFYAPEHQDILKEAFFKCMTEGIHYDMEIQLQTKEGSRTWVRTKGKPVYNSSHEIIKVRGIIQNIDDQKLREIKLEESFNIIVKQNERLFNFAHIVSHNLRSHSGNLELILSLIKDPDITLEEKDEYLQNLDHVSVSLNETIAHLNEVVAIQINENKKVPINIKHTFNSIKNSISKIIEDNDAKIIPHFEVETIDHIPAYLDSILLNLLTNSLKYKHPKRPPEINIKTYREDNHVVLTVSDNGLGIDLKKYENKIFGMYNTFHNQEDARGIGLFMTKNQVESLDGKIEVFSEPNVGTTFKITF